MEQNVPSSSTMPFDAGAQQYLLDTTRSAARKSVIRRATIAAMLVFAILTCPLSPQLQRADASASSPSSSAAGIARFTCPNLRQVIASERAAPAMHRFVFVARI